MKPQDLFLSLRDFFAVFVPGAVAIYIFLMINSSALPKTSLVPGAETLLIAAAAYGVGSLFFAIGSRLDHLYDRIELLILPRDRRERLEMLDEVATDAKERAISSVEKADEALKRTWSNKSFWSDRLRMTCPVASAELDRVESVQKFFRTFAVVLLLATANAALTRQWAAAGACLLAAAFCLGSYGRHRADWTYRLRKWVFLSLLK